MKADNCPEIFKNPASARNYSELDETKKSK